MNKRTPYILLFLLLFVFLGTGCLDSSSSDDDSSGQTDNGNGDGNGNGNGDGGDNGDGDAGLEPLQGAWTSGCVFIDGENQILERHVDGNIAEGYFEIFDEADTSCANTPVFSGYLAWEISAGDEITTDSGVTARELDIELTDDPDGLGAPDNEYDIFRVEGDTPYFGDNPSTSPENRPTALDWDTPFHRMED
ncbi:hypothetical protein [Natronospira sp.]|uniref:hypothetical protein n=1 Tax=Natronospira sp. TaxID=2024970 RepID=UPI0038730FDC